MYLLLVLTPPKTKFGDCLLPSANEVVLGRPLISSSASSSPTPKAVVSLGRLSLLPGACVFAVLLTTLRNERKVIQLIRCHAAAVFALVAQEDDALCVDYDDLVS